MGKKWICHQLKTWLSTNANYLRSLYRTTGRVVHCVFKSRVASKSRLIEKSGINAFIYDSAGNQIFSEKAQFTKEEERQLDKRMHTDSDIQQVFHNRYDITEIESSGRSTILLLTSRRVLFQQLFMNYAAILGIGLLLIVILLVGLNRLFKRYSQQVQLILEATRAIGDGNLKERIDTNQVQEELNDIASAINFMVDSLDQYIHDIYTLEIKQRDAHMRALQSQINPHFLYNTLEYIRMYALSRQQEELADVVYAFQRYLGIILTKKNDLGRGNLILRKICVFVSNALSRSICL